MRKNVTQLEVEIEGKRFLFICDSDSPLGLVKKVLMDFHNHCDEVEKAILEQIEKNKELEECCQGD